jgi:outer membrane lipoprotein-sorting protein
MDHVAAATIAMGLVTGSLGSGCSPRPKLSAAEIVARNVAARGGLDAWRKVETMVWIGHIESPRSPVPGMRFMLEQKRPNRMRLQVDAPGERSVRVFDGVHGWKLRPTPGRREAQPYTPEELRFAQAGHGIDGPLIDHVANGSSVTLEGVEEVVGRKAYHLTVRPAKGGDEQVWVDAETYLDLRYDRMTEGSGGAPHHVTAIYGDYRSVEGLHLPYSIETASGPGAVPDRMKIETVVLNAPLDDSTFDDPTAPHERHRVRPAPPLRAPPATASSSGPTTARSTGRPAPR